jgi:hypothetical protein
MSAGGFARDWKFWVLAMLAVICAGVTVFNTSLRTGVRERQVQLAARQQFINESMTLARVNSQLIQTLANMSAQSNDEAIREMLARHGVTFSTPPATSGQPQ